MPTSTTRPLAAAAVNAGVGAGGAFAKLVVPDMAARGAGRIRSGRD
jgi:hypothetical protein